MTVVSRVSESIASSASASRCDAAYEFCAVRRDSSHVFAVAVIAPTLNCPRHSLAASMT